MHLKLIFFFFTISTLASCQLTGSKHCGVSAAESLGLQHGIEGIDYRLEYYQNRCPKEKSDTFKIFYSQGLKRGLEAFCNSNRGSEQAKLGLDKEKVCAKIKPYNQGYELGLKEICTPKKALEDAKSYFNNTHRPCLQIMSYKEAYLKALTASCSLTKGYELGSRNIPLNLTCSDSPSYDSFLKAYKSGQSKYFALENKNLNFEVLDLQRRLVSLKRLPQDQLTQEEMLEMNRLESALLDAQHRIEQNKNNIGKNDSQ